MPTWAFATFCGHTGRPRTTVSPFVAGQGQHAVHQCHAVLIACTRDAPRRAVHRSRTRLNPSSVLHVVSCSQPLVTVRPLPRVRMLMCPYGLGGGFFARLAA